MPSARPLRQIANHIQTTNLKIFSMTQLPPKPTSRCPICREPTAAVTRPFCSKRCADVDLNRWLSESYVIADGGVDADEDGERPRTTDEMENEPPLEPLSRKRH